MTWGYLRYDILHYHHHCLQHDCYQMKSSTLWFCLIFWVPWASDLVFNVFSFRVISAIAGQPIRRSKYLKDGHTSVNIISFSAFSKGLAKML